MKILLDENMPIDFGDLLPEFEVHHVEHLGIKGIKNGALIKLARDSYDALITLDKGILHQHNHTGQPLIVLVIRVSNSKPETVKAKSEEVATHLRSASAGAIIEV